MSNGAQFHNCDLYLDHRLEVSAVPTEQIKRTRTAEQVEKQPDLIATATLYLAICLMQLVCPC